MRLHLNMVVFRVQDQANARLTLEKAGFEPREILIKLPQTARVSRFVVYRGHGLAVSVKDNYAVAQPESLDQTLCFPEQTPDFIEILKALKRCLVPENITLFIEQEKKGVLPAWYSTLSKKGFKTGKYGILPQLFQTPTAMFEMAGLPVLTKDRKKAAFDTWEHAQVLNKWAMMYKMGYLPKEMVEGGEWLKATELYQSGELAILLEGPNFVFRVKDNAPDIYNKSDVAPALLGRSQLLGLWYATLNIVKGSKHPKEAAEFATFVSNEVNELKFCQLAGIFPTRKAVLDHPFFSKDDGTFETKIRLTAVKSLKAATVFKYDIPHKQELFDKLRETLISVFLGEKEPYKALKECAQYWNEKLAEGE